MPLPEVKGLVLSKGHLIFSEKQTVRKHAEAVIVVIIMIIV